MNEDLLKQSIEDHARHRRIVQEQIDKALDCGLIEIVGFDAVGEPIYCGVQK